MSVGRPATEPGNMAKGSPGGEHERGGGGSNKEGKLAVDVGEHGEGKSWWS